MSGNDAGDGRGAEREQARDEDLSQRLKRLETQIERKRPSAPPGPSSRSGSSTGPSPLGQAMRLSTEFIAGVLAGGILGWMCDHFLGTKPWGLIVLLMLGFLTGVYNVMRVSGSLSKAPTKERDR
ncbi:ATP F0F1 synthase subunit I [Methylobacterium sp. Leaf469]|uniref:AtpZ/AtpI family protein n=1 Tax=unclassified Methylobacterium TaxID=2615210 RepID=UPI0006F9B9AE|nr:MULTISPECIES: AtpZ/AtpI family protein [unclassified Methylobacterium]USU30983.1 AtpZ/AtpI family protein [Methylobacterium sp. OTU13CASTA1]KQO71239.1 ATP F0F1 synthase subunit I [Methylobacterium sp. Leaf87]KQP24677.1 ATP F0F1 synthase subunit I [Methylobacterium sp. Leaf102]KQP36027.1 ATP F0F1 synthase subunit I [Methylobacterium sp. Leaf100]KQP60472.1 ATP F0F1 synthase subunit I [Methylobacterium sp. Leaf112]